jgi:hypothetical protein
MPFKKVTNTIGGSMPTIEPGTYTVTVLARGPYGQSGLRDSVRVR